jgi:tRNA1(Val) A37 N6-methylase TrmN6
MNYYNETDEKLAKLLNVGTSFDVIRREVGKEVKVILYFLSSLADSERVNELNVSLMLSDSRNYLMEQVSSGSIEIQKDVYELAQESIKLNNFEDQIEIINDDLINIYQKIGANKYDIVSCNPPYFKYIETSNINKNDYLTIARHEVKATLEDIVIESKKLLVDGGYLYMVHRVERIAEIMECFSKNCFQIKTMRFVYSKEDSNEAMFVLIEARKNKNPGTKILKPLYIYNKNNEYTPEVLEIFNFGIKSN